MFTLILLWIHVHSPLYVKSKIVLEIGYITFYSHISIITIENSEIKTHKPWFNTRYDLGNPYRRKPNWKVRVLCSLPLHRKWLRVQRSMACGLWATIMHKSFLCSLSPIPFDYFYSFMEQMHSKEWNPFSSYLPSYNVTQ